MLLIFLILDGATEEQMQEFLGEIQLMKQIGYHQNILNLLACCTMTNPMFLVVEFAKNRDLLHYLRSRREQVMWDNRKSYFPFNLLNEFWKTGLLSKPVYWFNSVQCNLKRPSRYNGRFLLSSRCCCEETWLYSVNCEIRKLWPRCTGGER